jgi:hypothetical protein
MVLLVKSLQDHDMNEDATISRIAYDEFYDASDNILFQTVRENVA